jgi:hypothetical protein
MIDAGVMCGNQSCTPFKLRTRLSSEEGEV